MMCIFIEIMRVSCNHDLIGLLEILLIHKIIRNLCGKRIESDALQMISECQITRYFHHFFQRVHQLYRRA